MTWKAFEGWGKFKISQQVPPYAWPVLGPPVITFTELPAMSSGKGLFQCFAPGDVHRAVWFLDVWSSMLAVHLLELFCS